MSKEQAIQEINNMRNSNKKYELLKKKWQRATKKISKKHTGPKSTTSNPTTNNNNHQNPQSKATSYHLPSLQALKIDN
jgi:hypothetical protein